MGSLKNYYLELNDDRDEWIRRQLGDPAADETTKGWHELESEYFDRYFSYTTEEELVELSAKTPDSFLQNILSDIAMLREVIAHNNIAAGLELPVYKMAYAHAVTLLESYLAETVKYLVLYDDTFFRNALSQIEELKKNSPTLLDVWNHREGVKGIAVERLSDVLYHNISKVKIMIEAILGKRLDIDIRNIQIVVLTRHDIAHRNGKTREGDEIELDIEIVENAFQEIEAFATKINSAMKLAIDELPF